MSDLAQKLFRQMNSAPPLPWWTAPLRGAARGASWLYGLASGLRNLAYDLELLRPGRLPVPVVGVGNLTLGGTGKTPLVMEVVRALMRLGLPAGVISRGYGGSASRQGALVSRGRGPLLGVEEAGDEPVLLARSLPVPVAVGAERLRAGRIILSRCGPRVLVGDDLFQHRRLHRDLDLVALDAADPLGGGFLLPRGRLREAPAGLRRAQAVILTRAEDQESLESTRAWLRNSWGPGPVLACRHRLAGLEDREGAPVERADWGKRPVLAFCGLARPRAFRESLEDLGLPVCGLEAFPDHHRFTPTELAQLARKAKELGAAALVTSQKDAVRLPAQVPPEPPILVTRLELEFQEGARALDALLAWGLAGWRPQP